MTVAAAKLKAAPRAGTVPVRPAGARGAKPAPPAAAPPVPRGRRVPLTPMRQQAAKSMRRLADQVQKDHPDLAIHTHVRDAARLLESGNEEGAQRHLRAAAFSLTPQSLHRNGVFDDTGHIAARQAVHGVHRHLLLVKDIEDVRAKNEAAISRASYGDDTSSPPPAYGGDPGALAQKPVARQPGGDRALNAPDRTNSGGSDPAVADPVGKQPKGSKQFGYTWDDLATVIALTGDANHRHIPGSPYEWRHFYIPLTEAAAKSHFRGKIPKGWSPPSGGGAGKAPKVSAFKHPDTARRVQFARDEASKGFHKNAVTSLKIADRLEGHEGVEPGTGTRKNIQEMIAQVRRGQAAKAAVKAAPEPAGKTAAAKPDKAAARVAKAEQAQRDAEAQYKQANDAYQAALKHATGKGGSYNPRSPEAQKAERLRQPMLDARSNVTKARLTALAERGRAKQEAAKAPEARPNTVVQSDPKTGELREMTQKETAEAAGKYATTLKPGSAERAEVERQAMDIARGGPGWQRMKQDADALRPLVGKQAAKSAEPAKPAVKPPTPKPSRKTAGNEKQLGLISERMGGGDRTSGEMKAGDMLEGHQAIAQAPTGAGGGAGHQEVNGHLVRGSFSDPWWMAKPGGGFAVSTRFRSKAQDSYSFKNGKSTTTHIPAQDKRVLTPVSADMVKKYMSQAAASAAATNSMWAGGARRLQLSWDDLAAVVELSARTAMLERTPAPRGKPGGPGLYDVKGLGHTAYEQQIVKALIEKRGMPPGKAYAIARGAIRRWSRGGGKVHPEVRAAAARAEAGEVAKQEQAKAVHGHAVTWSDVARVVELVGPHGYVHGWIKVGPGDASAGNAAKYHGQEIRGDTGNGVVVGKYDHAQRTITDRNGVKHAVQAVDPTAHEAGFKGDPATSHLPDDVKRALSGYDRAYKSGAVAKRLQKEYRGPGAQAGASSVSFSWDDVAAVVEFAASRRERFGPVDLATVIALTGTAAGAAQDQRIPPGQLGGGQFGTSKQGAKPQGKQQKGKPPAKPKPLSPAQQKAAKKAGLLKQAAADRAKAAGILRQIAALQKVIAAAQKGTGKTINAKSNVTKSNAPAKTGATANTTASNAASSTASTASSAAKSTASKTASSTASKTAAATAAAKKVTALRQQYKQLMTAAAQATAQAAKL